MLFIRKHLLLLLLIFLFSVFIRLPTLNRPLSKHHEFCTAVALRILHIWHQAGIFAYGFNPVMTYPHAADKFINNYASGSGSMTDSLGNYYYVSHPPLAYYFPFVTFKILHIKPDVLPIELFNLFIHLLCGIGVFLIARMLLPAAGSQPSVAAFASFSAYLLSPGTLWFHSNVYMSDILVQLFFIYGVYCFLKFSKGRQKKWLVLLGVVSFLMTYTSWLGVFFCATAVLAGILRKDWQQAVAVLLFTTAAIFLTVFQYSQIAGLGALQHEWLSRFSERSGRGALNVLRVVPYIFQNYLTSYLPLMLSILALLLASGKIKSLLTGRLGLFMALSAIPIMLLHVMLSNYSGHDFTTLYGGLFLSVIFGLLAQDVLQKIKLTWISLAAVALVTLCVAQYYYINRPGEFSLRGDRYAGYRDLGRAISREASDDEVIFLMGLKPSPETIFYAGRNIKQIQDEREALDFLKRHGRKKGVVLEASGAYKVAVRGKVNLNF